MFWVELAPWGAMDVIVSLSLRSTHQPGGWVGAGGQAKWAVVNEEWKRGEIVMCIAVPDTSILAESNQLVKYSSPSNSQKWDPN